MSDRMTVDSDELGADRPLSVDDTGTMTLSFRVSGVRHKTKYDDTSGEMMELAELEYDLEFTIQGSEVKPMSIRDALQSSLNEQRGDSIRVRPLVEQFPG